MLKFSCIILIVWSVSAQSEVYKSIDSNGKVHYSDKPISSKSNKIRLQTSASEIVQKKNPSELSKASQENKNEVKNNSLVKHENSEYCAGVKSEMEYNKSGGEIIVVDGNKFERANEEHRQKSYKYLENEYKTYCL